MPRNTYVQPSPATGTKQTIARGGRPIWSRDGKELELYYIPAPAQWYMVRVTTQPIFAFTPPVAVPRPFGVAGPGSPRTFDFLPDGRIIGVGATAQGTSGAASLSQIHVVVNWFEDPKARVPVK